MGRVAVVTDTTAYLPPEMLAEREIPTVSLYVNWSDRSEREADISDRAAFYDRLRSAEQLPTTSQPSIGDFLEVYEPLVQAGTDVVSIHISGNISGTVEGAHQAAEQVASGSGSGRVTVVDSHTGCGGLGAVVLAADRVAKAGGDTEAVEQRAIEARDQWKLWFAVDTLEYLRRGGRIGAASAWLGAALKIKPILTLTDQITPIERVRTSARAIQRLLDYAQQRRDYGATAWVVQHVQAPDQAARLVEAVEEIMPGPPLFVSEIGPVIGIHVGPGLLGFGALPPELLD